MGATIAAAFVNRHPARAGKLVMIDPVAAQATKSRSGSSAVLARLHHGDPGVRHGRIAVE
jgi:pimeloyl-ACP methyl ester carboxylesterase